MNARRMARSIAVLVTLAGGSLAAGSLAGCASSHEVPIDPLVVGATASALVGPEGATLQVGSMEVRIPAGALATPTTITVSATGEATPAIFTAYTPVVRFEPAGLPLAAPMQVRIPFEGDAALATAFLTQTEHEAFGARVTRIEGSYAIVESAQLETMFVGTACEGETCTDQGNGELDVLIVVDDSNSMSEEQALLAAQLPRLVEVLASGDRDGDGVQDFPAVANIHFGFVSTDLGAGDATVSTCSGVGDDALLQTNGCGMSSGILGWDAATGDLATLTSNAACVANLGTRGCGFESQLESMLAALSPNAATAYTAPGYVPPTVRAGLALQGDTGNAGFLRDASILTVVHVTDEDDSSVLDPELYNPISTVYAGSLNARAALFPSALEPTSRYVDGLLALRTNPADSIFAAVTGVPVEAVADTANVDFDALLALPEMTPTVTDAGDRVLPVCESGTGTATPARRIVETAAALETAGGSAVVASICDESFDALLDGLITRIGARAAGHS